MDKIDKLYNLYKSKGLITDATPIDKFRSATEEQKVKLYNLGKSKNLFKTTDINTFSSAWGEPTPVKKKEESDLPLDQEDTSLGSPEMETQEPSEFSQFQKEDSQYKPFANFGPVESKAKTKESQSIEREKVIKESKKGIFKDVAVYPGDLTVVQDKGISKVARDYEALKAKADRLQEKYGDLGFKFEANESEYFGDDITVTADDGTAISINTSSINEYNKEDAKKLEEFLFSKSAGQKKRDLTPAEMLVYSNRTDYEGFSKSKYDRIYTDENIKKSLDFVNEKINADLAGIKETQKELSDLQSQIEEMGDATPQETLEEFNSKAKMYNSKIKDIKSSSIIADQAIKNVVAERIERDVEKGNWASATYNGFVNGAEDLAKGIVDVMYEGTDMLTRPLAPMNQEKKAEQMKAIKEWMSSAFDEKRAKGITDAYLQNQNMAMTALFSVPEFLPTLMMPGGPLARIATMSTQGIGRRMEEYDNSPEMKAMMSREEAFLLNTVKATIEAKLENVGITQALSRSGLANSLAVKALQKWSPKMGTKALNGILSAEVNSLAAKAALNTAGAFIVEAETGALQNIMETGINELYNVAKEKEVFKQPKVFTKEWTESLVKDAVMEGLGGMWMGGAVNVARYTAEGVLGKRLSDQEFGIVKQMLSDGFTAEAMMVDLKNKVINGEISNAEMQKTLSDFNRAAAIVSQMPEGDLSEGQQRGAFDLINERQRLEEQIKGKDPNLVTRKTKRISEINERLKLISENAVQEQTTSEVPVQPETAVGEEVAEGAPEAESEVVTEEIPEEEIVEEEVEVPAFTMKEALDNPSNVYVLDGKKGNLTIVDGNILAFETEDQIVDLGAIDEISDSSIEDFGISQEATMDLTLNEDNSITYNGVNYYNNYSNPDAAIDMDKDGNYVVRLETENGQKRTFRGQQAQEIVYQTRLKNFEQNATEEQIESANTLADEAIRAEEQARETAPKRKGKVVRKGERKKTTPVITAPTIVEETVEPEVATEEEVTEEQAIEEAVAEEESRPLEARKPRIQAIEEESSKIKKSASSRTFTAKQANELKKALRKFINDSLPKAMWTTPEVKKILNEIQKATIKKNYNRLIAKPQDDIRQVMSKVIDLVNEKSSKIYMTEIQKLMDVKAERKESGRMKGNFTADGVDRVNAFKNDMGLSEKSPLDQVDGKIEQLNEEKREIEEKVDLTEDDLKRLEMIDIAILYNSALNMDNKSQAKVVSLEEVARKIKVVLSGEKSDFREAQKQKHERYIQEQQDALESITGIKVDLRDPDSVKNFERQIENIENKKKNRAGIKRMLSNIAKQMDSVFVLKSESIEGLLDRITMQTADVFGGKLSTLIRDRVDESSRNYKKNKNETLDIIENKAKEIFGQNWKSEMKKNNKNRVRLYYDKAKVDELNNELKNTTDKNKRRKIVEEIEELTMPSMTQNQMYYHYNQYKDPSNIPSYEVKWRDNPDGVMKQIEENLDPKVKEWADWQVNEFFPSVYEQYNQVYRNIYNTNMPWNEFYAGRIFRETNDEIDADSVGLISTKFQNSLTNASTKARVKNKQKIRDMDGNSALLSYVSDMEYFRAYAENMRDISKIYSTKNGLVKKAIEATTSKDTYNVIFGQDASNPGMIAKIMNRGFNMRGSESEILDVMTRNFVISRLGLNPTIFLKQMTSALAFADYIGYRNWTKYGLMELKNGIAGFNSSWKEMYENSVELQNRYDSKDFTRVLESYSKEEQDVLSGNVSMGKFMDFMMYLVKQGDKGGVMGSIPNYAYYKDQYKRKNPNASNQQVIDYAVRKVEQEIKNTQQDQDVQNKDFYQTGNWYQRWLGMFQSSSRALLRKEILATRNLYRKLSKWDKEAGTGTLRQNIRMFTTYHVVLPMFFQYIALGMPGLLTDMDDEDKEALGMAAVVGNLNSLFIVGQIFNMAIDYIKGNPWAGDATDLPILELASNFFGDISKMNKAKSESTKNKYKMKLLGSALDLGGIPGSQANKLYQNYKNIAESDFNTPEDYKEATARLLGYSDYQIKPPKRKSIKRKKVKTAFD